MQGIFKINFDSNQSNTIELASGLRCLRCVESTYYVNCRSKVLKDMPRIEGRPGQELPPLDFDKLKADLRDTYPDVSHF